MKKNLAKYLRHAGEYSKAVVGATGGVVTTLAAVLGLGDTISPTLSGYLVAASAALTSFGVWLTKNQATIERVGNESADLLER